VPHATTGRSTLVGGGQRAARVSASFSSRRRIKHLEHLAGALVVYMLDAIYKNLYNGPRMKDLFWVGSSLGALRAFPDDARRRERYQELEAWRKDLDKRSR